MTLAPIITIVSYNDIRGCGCDWHPRAVQDRAEPIFQLAVVLDVKTALRIGAKGLCHVVNVHLVFPGDGKASRRLMSRHIVLHKQMRPFHEIGYLAGVIVVGAFDPPRPIVDAVHVDELVHGGIDNELRAALPGGTHDRANAALFVIAIVVHVEGVILKGKRGGG